MDLLPVHLPECIMLVLVCAACFNDLRQASPPRITPAPEGDDEEHAAPEGDDDEHANSDFQYNASTPHAPIYQHASACDEDGRCAMLTDWLQLPGTTKPQLATTWPTS
jgi:hypothetical protein